MTIELSSPRPLLASVSQSRHEDSSEIGVTRKPSAVKEKQVSCDEDDDDSDARRLKNTTTTIRMTGNAGKSTKFSCLLGAFRINSLYASYRSNSN